MDRWVPALKLIGIGFYIATCMLLGTGAGLWLDGKFTTSPVFTVVGLFAGLVLAGYGVYRMLRQVMDNKNNGENHE